MLRLRACAAAALALLALAMWGIAIDETAMAGDITKIKGRWVGDLDQDSHGIQDTFPMILTVDTIDGNEFSGTIDWPRNGDTRTKVQGMLEGDILKWTETEYLRGDDVVLAGLYIAKFETQGTITGTWMDPKYVIYPAGPNYGTPGATLVLHRQ